MPFTTQDLRELIQVFPRSGADADVRSGLCQRHGDGPSDAAARAAHPSDLIHQELFGHVFTSLHIGSPVPLRNFPASRPTSPFI